MSMQKKLKFRGILMLIIFAVILGVFFSKVFPGQKNGFDFMDNLFNTISKGSSYFIPKSIKDADKFVGKEITVKIKAQDETQANEMVNMFKVSGAEATTDGKQVAVKGDMAQILKSCLADADNMFNNQGAPVATKYGFSEKQVMNNWWIAFKAISEDLIKQENFDLAKAFTNGQKKAIEPAYNYYGVDSKKWQENLTMILAALGFYVFYTLWYGFGLMYLFEGLGLKIGH